MEQGEKKVVIVGGGFGGLNCAKILGNKKNLSVTLIDKQNFHLFQPLLYQVATAGLNAENIAVPLRHILAKYKNINILMGEVLNIDFAKRLVICDFQNIYFDYLVIATGATHSYFGKSTWADFAPGLKTLEQAYEIRQKIYSSFEYAERETNEEKRSALLTFSVVGGGPTGVEMAGTIAEICRCTLKGEYKNFNPLTESKIFLIEGNRNILQSFSQSLSYRAQRDLEKLGVTVYTSRQVTNIDATGLWLDAEYIPCQTIIWAAGVAPSPLGKALQTPLDSKGRVIVEKDLSLKTDKNTFVIGDLSSFKTEDEKLLPGLAPVAIQQGICAGKNIFADIRGKERANFIYFDKGQMATIGFKKAIVEFSKIKISGFIAWIFWVVVHIYYLIGFKNRFIVLLEWATSYFTYTKNSRLIITKKDKK